MKYTFVHVHTAHTLTWVVVRPLDAMTLATFLHCPVSINLYLPKQALQHYFWNRFIPSNLSPALSPNRLLVA
jgi:hypothetical protein